MQLLIRKKQTCIYIFVLQAQLRGLCEIEGVWEFVVSINMELLFKKAETHTRKEPIEFRLSQ